MSATVGSLPSGAAGAVLRDCFATLRGVATYRLPPAIDRRLQWLSENKGSLSSDERDELLALVDFAEDRTLEKVKAHATLQRLSELYPALAIETP